ncbi:MAG: hypothetical protein II034_09500 [Muribaculaceae bacterium]|nr:hypothetical protein [Muribaculaceae bacterium]
MSMSEFTIDANDVLRVFASLGVQDMQRVHKAAFRASARVLVKEARLKLAAVTGRSRSTRTADRKGWSRLKGSKKVGALNDGVRYYVSRNNDFAKVHIMGDFRLKWFEMGTEDRFTREDVYKGRMRATRFFAHSVSTAKNAMEDAFCKTVARAVKSRVK